MRKGAGTVRRGPGTATGRPLTPARGPEDIAGSPRPDTPGVEMSEKKKSARVSRGSKGAPAKAPVQPGGPPQTTLLPVFKRGAETPIYYAPLIDVRLTQQGFHLLTFIPPAPDAADVYTRDGQYCVDVQAGAEIVVPIEAVEPLVRNLASQLRAFVLDRFRKEAEAAGMIVEGELSIEGLNDILNLGKEG